MLIHNKIFFSVEANNPCLNDILAPLGDVTNLSNVSEASLPVNHNIPQVKLSYIPKFSLDGMRNFGDSLMMKPKVLVDLKYKAQLSTLSDGTLHLQSNNSSLEWTGWLMQLALLKTQATFMHVAGLEKNGKALLFPSWRGVSKTPLVNGFVKNYDWKLLGDDYVIVDDHGTCYSYPLPMTIYAYHKEIFPELFAQKNRFTVSKSFYSCSSFAALMLKPILRKYPQLLDLARRYNPKFIYLNPSEVFGEEKMASTAKLETVVWLDRVAGISEPILKPTDNLLASRIVSSTLKEQDPWVVEATNVACGLGILNFRHIYPDWLDIVEKAIADVKGWILYLPTEIAVEDVSKVVHNTLKQAQVLEDF